MISEKERIKCAIRHIQTAMDVDPWACDIAVEAMKKHIPEKPMKSLDVDTKSIYRLYCPTCGVKIGNQSSRGGYIVRTYGSEKCCGNCGQAIDWEEKTEDDRSD